MTLSEGSEKAKEEMEKDLISVYAVSQRLMKRLVKSIKTAVKANQDYMIPAISDMLVKWEDMNDAVEMQLYSLGILGFADEMSEKMTFKKYRAFAIALGLEDEGETLGK